ncbi:pentatricopeptide repeat-containing protein CRR2, chloroplastic-like [Wolffia australiana]
MPLSQRTIPFFARLLDSILASRALFPLLQTHAQALTSGTAPSDLLRTKLSAAYARCGRLRDAQLLFLRANRRPLFLYNALLRGYADLGLLPPSLRLRRQLLLHGKTPNPQTISSLLRACASSASLRHGKVLHSSAIAVGLSSSASVTNSLISMYAKCGDLSLARELFERMPARNLASWTAMVGGLAAHGCSSEALKVFDEMLSLGEKPDAMAVTAALSACCRGGWVEVGGRIFEEMEGRFGVRPTLEHYTCLVELMGRAGRVEEAERLVMGMEFEPDEALWGALLAACRAHGKLDVALRVAKRACSSSSSSSS